MVIASVAGLLPAAGAGIWISADAGIGVLVGCLGVGAIAGLAFAATRSTRLVATAARVDEALELRDRLSSGLELAEETGEDRAFSQLAVRDAEAHAASVRVSRAVPLRGTRDWLLWPVFSAAAVAAVLLLPAYLQQQSQASPGELARARESIVRAAQVVEEENAAEASMPEADQSTLDRLNDIERELAEGRRTPDDAKTESAAVLEERARELAEEAEREQGGLEQRLSEIKTDPDSSVSDLAEALRSGDFAETAERLRELARDAKSMDDQSRQELADDLREIARQLASEPRDSDESESGQAGTEQPRPQQVSPEQAPETEQTPGQSQNPESERPVEQTRPAERPQENEETFDAGEQTPPENQPRSATEELSDRLSETADQIERNPESLQPDRPERPQENPQQQEQQQPDVEPEQQSPGQDKQSGSEQQQEQRQEGENQRGEEGQRPDEQDGQRQAGQTESERAQTDPQSEQGESGQQEQTSPEQQQQPGNEQGARPEQGEKPAGSPDEQQTEQQPAQQEQPGRETEGGEPRAQPGADQQAQPKPEQGAPQPGEQPVGQEDQQQPGEQPQGLEPSGEQSPGEQPVATPGGDQLPGTRPQQQDQTQATPGGSDSLQDAIEQLEKMDQQQLESLRKMARSQKFQDAARDLLDDASPEELERLSEFGRRLAENRGAEAPVQEPWNPETELFDARGDQEQPAGEDSRVAGETERTGAEPSRTLARTTSQDLAARMREAAAGVERAIEGQTIPTRTRDYVRRVYQRYEKSASEAPAREGRDADAPASDSE